MRNNRRFRIYFLDPGTNHLEFFAVVVFQEKYPVLKRNISAEGEPRLRLGEYIVPGAEINRKFGAPGFGKIVQGPVFFLEPGTEQRQSMGAETHGRMGFVPPGPGDQEGMVLVTSHGRLDEIFGFPLINRIVIAEFEAVAFQFFRCFGLGLEQGAAQIVIEPARRIDGLEIGESPADVDEHFQTVFGGEFESAVYPGKIPLSTPLFDPVVANEEPENVEAVIAEIPEIVRPLGNIDFSCFRERRIRGADREKICYPFHLGPSGIFVG